MNPKNWAAMAAAWGANKMTKLNFFPKIITIELKLFNLHGPKGELNDVLQSRQAQPVVKRSKTEIKKHSELTSENVKPRCFSNLETNKSGQVVRPWGVPCAGYARDQRRMFVGSPSVFFCQCSLLAARLLGLEGLRSKREKLKRIPKMKNSLVFLEFFPY